MMYEYPKQLVRTERKFTVCKIGAETEEALGVSAICILPTIGRRQPKKKYMAQFAARKNVEGRG